MATRTSLDSEFRALLHFRLTDDGIRDLVRVDTALYEADKDGIPVLDGNEAQVGRDVEIKVWHHSGGGALVDLLRNELRHATERIVPRYILRHLVRHIDFALFAIDHDGGHGLEVEHGVRELWLASGSDTWAAYATRRKALFRWLKP